MKYYESNLGILYNGDCTEILKKVESNSVDLVVTSPPYNCGIDYDVYDDNKEWVQYYEWCYEWMGQIYRVLKDDGRFCLNHYLSLGQSNNRYAPLMKLNELAMELEFKHHSIAIWTDITLTKRTAWGSWLSASAPYVNSPYEGILILYKNEWKKQREGESTIDKERFMKLCTGIWDMQTEMNGLTKANFPLELPLNCIDLLSYVGDTVLDPFAGSGTTCVASEMRKRKWMGIELSTNYCKIATRRIKHVAEQTELTSYVIGD